jgi:hypothetical protein
LILNALLNDSQRLFSSLLNLLAAGDGSVRRGTST